MNCFSGLSARHLSLNSLRERHWALLLGVFIISACGVATSESAGGSEKRDYDAHYELEVDPLDAAILVSLQIRQPRHLLRELRFTSLSDRFDGFSADGELTLDDNSLTWLIPEKGGTLTWRVSVNHRRGQSTYDAWLGSEWGIFRAEDIIPRARTRALKGSTSNTTFSFSLPTGWSAVSEYSGLRDPVPVQRPDRRFDEPTGWLVVGDIGVRRETIAGIRVAVAGPQGHSIRRLDMLAFMNWVLPELTELLPDPPERLTIVSAGEPMWRGGLSAPASLFIHAERPMISENGTSPILHEVMHTALALRADEESDWIVEALAEYYGIELLRAGNAISARRHRIAIAEQADWAAKAASLCGETSTGATTALGVTILHTLNQEILDKTSGDSNLDDLLRHLIAQGPTVSVKMLRSAAAKLIGEPSDALHSDKLPGCPRMAPGEQSG
ncbi:MAG: hypothetical protein KJO09_13750 [Gammaproteobacteria bacterium]|nr:hypothetical protein [Gammaproteobacteria bacterium]